MSSAGLNEVCSVLPKLDGHSTLGAIYHCLQTTGQGSLLAYVEFAVCQGHQPLSPELLLSLSIPVCNIARDYSFSDADFALVLE